MGYGGDDGSYLLNMHIDRTVHARAGIRFYRASASARQQKDTQKLRLVNSSWTHPGCVDIPDHFSFFPRCCSCTGSAFDAKQCCADEVGSGRDWRWIRRR